LILLSDDCISQVDRVLPLLKSTLVSSEAYETMEKLAGCVATPLRHLGPDLAATLRMVALASVLKELQTTPPVAAAAATNKGKRENEKLGVVDRVVMGLVIACKDGPLPAPSFALVFPVRTLSSHKLLPRYHILWFLWYSENL
jgi:hypothetical protein